MIHKNASTIISHTRRNGYHNHRRTISSFHTNNHLRKEKWAKFNLKFESYGAPVISSETKTALTQTSHKLAESGYSKSTTTDLRERESSFGYKKERSWKLKRLNGVISYSSWRLYTEIFSKNTIWKSEIDRTDRRKGILQVLLMIFTHIYIYILN